MQNADGKTRSAAALQRRSSGQSPDHSGETDALFGKTPARPFFQAKLSVNQPGDAYEQEADHVADQVVQRLAEGKSQTPAAEKGNSEAPPGIQRLSITPLQRSAMPALAPATIQAKCAGCEQEDKLQKKEEEEPEVQPKLQRKPVFDSAAPPPPGDGGDDASSASGLPYIQRKPIFESAAPEEGGAEIQRKEQPGWGALQMKCADCAAEEEKGNVQREAAEGGAPTPSADFASRLQSSKGGGSPLPADVSSSMGEAMGADFSNVRVHTGGEAAGMSNSIQAQAFTHGNDVYFNEGKYNPGSSDGQRLLAHELVHTVQQGGGIKRKPAEQQKDEAVELTGKEPETKDAGVQPEQAPSPPAAAPEPKIEEIPDAAIQAKAIETPVLQRADDQEDVQRKPAITTTTGAPKVQRGLWSSITNAVSSLASSIDPRQWLNRAAMNIPGFRLVTVIIGYNPIIQEDVPRTAENFIGGFLGLLGPIGNALFAKLQETNAISMALTWLDQQVTALGITLSYIGSLITRILDSISITDISGSISRALDILREPARRIMNFLGRLAEKIKEFIFRGALQLIGAPVDMVMGILNRAGNILRSIFEDPIGFIGNLVNAIKGGLMNFMQNIGRHLLNGMVNWLFGALQGAGIQLPQRWDLPGIFSLVMQVLNLTYQQGVRPRMVRFLGEAGVARLEQAFEFIRDVMTRGPIAIWERIREFLGNLREMVMDGIKSFVITRLVQAGITRLVSMFNPAGALIQAVMAIWNTIQFFIERAQQIASFVNAVFESISNIASGAIGTAATWIENALARAIPVILGFLARLIGLGNISEQIRNIIARVRAPIDAAIDRVVNWVVAQGRRLVGAVTGRGAAAPADNPNQNRPELAAVEQSIRSQGQEKGRDGEVSRGDADLIAANVRRDNPNAIGSITVVDGGATWKFEYVQRTESEIQVPKNSNEKGRDLIDKVADPLNPPEGYTFYDFDGGNFKIRRLPGKAEEGYIKLTITPRNVDGDGPNKGVENIMKEGAEEGSSNRISGSGALTRSLGGARPNHQAHHIIPDAVVRSHPLMQIAKNSGYNLDEAHNGIMMPCNDEGKNTTSNLPIHRGSHPLYNQEVSAYLTIQDARLRRSNLINDANVITTVVNEVEGRFRRSIESNSIPKLQ